MLVEDAGAPERVHVIVRRIPFVRLSFFLCVVCGAVCALEPVERRWW